MKREKNNCVEVRFPSVITTEMGEDTREYRGSEIQSKFVRGHMNPQQCEKTQLPISLFFP